MSQADRREQSRSALLESAARGLSRYGYGKLRLEDVARDAGYTRGALYHQFKDKEHLALAVVDWVGENWIREVGDPARDEPTPVAELLALARGHAVFCRRDIARVVMALRVEFSGQDHPVGRAIERVRRRAWSGSRGWSKRGVGTGRSRPGRRRARLRRRSWARSRGPRSRWAGERRTTSRLAERAAAGVLGLDSPPAGVGRVAGARTG